ncbi:hypothetical protein [Laspinema olomoucense]|uniref:hypothetical protein n=1 Tax=Laspinema olomoucense TaxID=3231600 RepID=UPI0021BB3544|nr:MULTISPECIES: hypothetical protein [unclassified Laspinema]MCT7973707.1 hypothetical protein [Laspinema sp. D3d]MCT7996594.1 hypothetical protein [Laspinema sp. D3c]
MSWGPVVVEVQAGDQFGSGWPLTPNEQAILFIANKGHSMFGPGPVLFGGQLGDRVSAD